MGFGVRWESRRIARRLAGQGAVLRSIVASVIRACTRQLHISASPATLTSHGGLVLGGIVGIQFYHLTLNDGETHVSAGIPVCKVRRFEKANLE